MSRGSKFDSLRQRNRQLDKARARGKDVDMRAVTHDLAGPARRPTPDERRAARAKAKAARASRRRNRS